jgi:hypothetical protein
VGCDNGLAGIIELVIGFFKSLLGIKKSGVKEDVGSDDKSLVGVQLDWDIVFKVGVEGALPEPGYEVSAVDAVNMVLADDVELDVDLGFVTLTLDGMVAKNWTDSGLAPVDVSFPVRYVYKYRQAGMTMARAGLVQARNNSAVIGKVRLPKGTELDGFVDVASGYFYFNTRFDVDVTLPELIHVEVAYAKAASGVVVGRVDEKTYRARFWIRGIVKIPEVKVEVEEEFDDREPELVEYNAGPIIRTTPRLKHVIKEIVDAMPDLNPSVPNNLMGANPYLLIEVDDKLVQADVYVDVKVNGDRVAVFNAMVPYRRVILPVEYGKKYDLDVKIVVDKAVMPHAIYDPILEIWQSKRHRSGGWNYERRVATVYGNDAGSLNTDLPIGQTSYRLWADRKDRSYTVRIGAGVVGTEKWILRGSLKRDGDVFVLRDFRVVTKINFSRDPRIEVDKYAEAWDVVSLSDNAKFKAVFYGVRKDWTVQGPVTVGGVDDLWIYRVVEFTKENEVLGSVIFDGIPDVDDVKKVRISVEGLVDDGLIWSYAPTLDEIVYEV